MKLVALNDLMHVNPDKVEAVQYNTLSHSIDIHMDSGLVLQVGISGTTRREAMKLVREELTA